MARFSLLGSGRQQHLRVSSPERVGADHNKLDALTASGARIKRGEGDAVRVQPWQARAFYYYDALGEIKYAAQFYARMLAPLRIYAAELDDEDEIKPTQNETAKKLLRRIQDPGGGRTGLLSSYGRLMFLTGEAILLTSKDSDTGLEQWEMLSTDELRISGNIITRYRAPSLNAEELREPSDEDWQPIADNEAIPYRLWKRHPRYSQLPDATMQGVLELCEELILLTQTVRARARSRLAGAGILVIDERISPAPLQPAGDEDPVADPFIEDLTEAMTAPIADEGSASSVVPLVVRVTVPDNMKAEDMIAHLQIVDPIQLYPETGLRRECLERIAIGLDMPSEILLGMDQANHWCVDAETEILTSEGWARHDTLEPGAEVLTLNHLTGLSEWQPVEDVAEFAVEDLPMLSIESRFHSSLTTMNHRWPVLCLAGRDHRWERDWTYSDELRSTHRLVTAAPSRNALLPQWVQHEDALVELVAWLWTEGQIRARPGRRAPQVVIYQSHTANPENVLRIRTALASLYGAPVAVPMRGGRGRAIEQEPRWREIPAGRKTAFVLNAAAASRLLDHVGPDRVVSTDFIRTLTASQLALFIETSTRADGSTMRSGCQIIGQKEAARLAPLELAAILLGRTPSSYSQTHDGFTVHEQHYVSVSDRQTIRLKREHLSERRYTGIVWCPVTGNSTWLARRNGKVYFTGNTAWQIDEQTWKGHGQPIAKQFCDDLTAAYFRPSLRDASVENWERFVIAFDPAEIINHPSRAADAKDLYAARAISKHALREANGFTDDDAMPPEEVAEAIGVAVRDPLLAVEGIVGGSLGEPSEEGGKAAPGQDAGEVKPGPPPPPTEPVGESAVGSANGAGAARILGASDLALYRCREAAGNRLRSIAKRDSEARDIARKARPSQVAFALGPERVKRLGAPATSELVAGARDLIIDAFHVWGLPDELAEKIAERVEEHAARTLFEERPAPFPSWFQNYVKGVTEVAPHAGVSV